MKKKSILDLNRMKREGEKVTWITAYDSIMAAYAEQAGMDMILVGDSMGMVVLGHDSTIPVTMEDCISHCQSVRRAAPNTFVVGDMPFGSYQISPEQAVGNAIRFLKEGGVDAIKLEGGKRVADRIRAITEAGIMVCGHVGLTPQSSGVLGGHLAQGRTVESARDVIEDAIAVYEAGAKFMLVEAVPPEVTAFIAKRLPIPVYSIGAGPDCDGQLTICADTVGMFQSFTPKFVKKYCDVASIILNAYKQYIEEIKSGVFPSDDYVYHIKGDLKDFEEMFKEYEE
jgi:3-methyl-2-oxobutanoate hydroxymethyltransferase